jgi:hypothetical protein
LSPRTLAWSATAAALAIVVQAGFLADIMLKETKRTGYETASAPNTDPGVGAFALIRFAPQASSDDVTKFLETNKLSIAAGPMAGGLYKVRVAVTGIPKGDSPISSRSCNRTKSLASSPPPNDGVNGRSEVEA